MLQSKEAVLNTLACVTANYVAREIGYRMTGGWLQGDEATQAFFRPLETFGARFGALLEEIRALGFSAIDLWLAHLSPEWATPEHIRLARTALEAREITVVSLAGGFGATPAAFERACQLARALEAPLLGGGAPLLASDRAAALDLLRRYGLRLGIENHPEPTPQALLAQIGGDSGGLVGATVDTGWFATQGYDAAQAIRELGPLVFSVHLKDIRAPGGHETVRYGQGCVPLRACVQALRAIGYGGPVSVEHEPEHHDPSEDVRASAALLRGWLAEEEQTHD